MKRKLLFCLLLGLALCGCQPKEEMTPMAQIQQRLTEMEGYSATATLTRISNKSETVYETRQDFKSTGEYRLELLSPPSVEGNVTIFDGVTVCQYNPRLEEKIRYDVPPSSQRNELFLGQFMKNYLQSEGVAVESAALDESRCTVLEAVIPSNADALASEKLWIDNETLLPVRLVLYDADGKERYRLDYTEFTYNPDFDENLFAIPE
ncbi:outer membrane lipoprotein carrier protein LolA [Anaerotignum lactatifermentans]|uniref:Outer membrane lipoprotein carrier protein LolA n=1 Tax=Anaerotignum lactatifermentans TaxID=160404 RepID=A0ABS2G6G9_9FIRM|nr:outer membrane lipoprotein carrier protein LolA [Anaerotignum lactatifermentans]MBM6828702.1 outer membrane lipoprotein carrier protein LolA [Anaerotignum lactatifermentans]MBM6877029.1 outer membrane lipoprotein carrier protein LolA [Anaerotignum lactatifermentans]MBM6950284.1 outer membrane lipoprotein carrier protein LolA [Anaerotignum lactatifermentans]